MCFYKIMWYSTNLITKCTENKLSPQQFLFLILKKNVQWETMEFMCLRSVLRSRLVFLCISPFFLVIIISKHGQMMTNERASFKDIIAVVLVGMPRRSFAYSILKECKPCSLWQWKITWNNNNNYRHSN